MKRDLILEEIREIVHDKLCVDRDAVNPASSFSEDLRADSLDRIQLIMEIEDRFGMRIPDEEAEKITTVADAVDYVAEHQAA